MRGSTRAGTRGDILFDGVHDPTFYDAATTTSSTWRPVIQLGKQGGPTLLHSAVQRARGEVGGNLLESRVPADFEPRGHQTGRGHQGYQQQNQREDGLDQAEPALATGGGKNQASYGVPHTTAGQRLMERVYSHEVIDRQFSSGP